MSRERRKWDPAFIRYMDFIVNHSNYKGLPITKSSDGSYKWIATAKSKIGKQRKEWALCRATELGFLNAPGVYADVMREIHPTKNKVCQICGGSMSIYYYYPTVNFLKALKKEFKYDFTQCTHLSDIWDALLENSISVESIKKFLVEKFKLEKSSLNLLKDELINKCEFACRKGGIKLLSPGAMSNFPDRYDGFHTYNRCCRASEDKGRSSENLKSYTKDRRAYEYWSDGNIHAANMFMGSGFFSGTSADHIGPISLGFVHDPRYLQPMDGGNNSAKRDRLQIEDIEKILQVEERTGIYPMSWYSSLIWEYIKKNYYTHQELVSTVYRDALKQNMVNFMFIIGTILDKCENIGETILSELFLVPKFDFFASSYGFNELGEITTISDRHYTDRNKNEMDRFRRIAIESAKDFNGKNNRNMESALSQNETAHLAIICEMILRKQETGLIKSKIEELMNIIQTRIISSI